MDMQAARQQAAKALEAGQKLALRAAQRQRGMPMAEAPSGAAIGALIGEPAAFWAAAAANRLQGDDGTVGAVALATKLAAAKLAAGDMGFIRESLIGQAQWLGVIATKMMAQADGEKQPDKVIGFIKLALAAQRQAAQSLASVAALDSLRGAGQEVTVGSER